MTTKTIFSVLNRNGTYTTQTVHGHHASRTSSYEDAARTLARKLHPYQAWELKLVDSSEEGTQVFELDLMR